jgi:putative ABC transport system ATP-binding protein
MHVLGALDTPTEGTASLDGHDLLKLNENDLVTLRGKKVGFVFQTFNLIQALTAQQNVELPMIFLGVKRKDRLERARYLLEKVGLGDRVPPENGSGERQRVAIARAGQRSEILLADRREPRLETGAISTS